MASSKRLIVILAGNFEPQTSNFKLKKPIFTTVFIFYREDESPILNAYGLSAESKIEPLTSGLINKTWKVTDGENQFILQQINHQVFKKPYDVGANIRMVDEYLKEHAPQYLFVAPISTPHHEDLFYLKDEGYFRLFPFIKGSHTINVVSSPEQAFEAAFHFGKFTRLLAGFDATKLHIAIPDFHNLSLRYRQFEEALKSGNPIRIKQSKRSSMRLKNKATL